MAIFLSRSTINHNNNNFQSKLEEELCQTKTAQQLIQIVEKYKLGISDTNIKELSKNKNDQAYNNKKD